MIRASYPQLSVLSSKNKVIDQGPSEKSMQTIDHHSSGVANLSSKISAKFANSEAKGSLTERANINSNNCQTINNHATNSLSPRISAQEPIKSSHTTLDSKQLYLEVAKQ